MSSAFVALFQSINQQLREHPTDELELILYFDDVERFSCSQCGRCCQLPWRVGLDQVFYEQWSEYWNTHADQRFHGALQIQTESSFYAAFKRAPMTGHCIFLEPDQACYIHRHLGAGALPAVCQRYPWNWVRRHTGQATLHLLESCHSAPLLLFGPQSLKWYLRPCKNRDTERLPTQLDSTHQLTPTAFHLWQGWMLDQLVTPTNGVVKALQKVIQGLVALTNQSLLILDEPDVLQALANIPTPEPINPLHSQRWQQQMASLWGLPPDWEQLPAKWSQAERRLLAECLQAYALRRLVVYGNWQEQPLNLVQESTWLMLCLLLLQTGLVQQQWQQNQPLLTQSLLRDVLNLQEIRLFHSQGWLAQIGLLDWDIATCLQTAQAILDTDLTQGL